ncbi:MAG: Gfo/Idh/MocA family oxidoreductase [Verrucomicrobiales bacterium]|nr:Gfo/Idh/MocA family oxidoreductase [Verrucomicrobiales bacterium]
MGTSDSTTLRWGILGTGNIARQFTKELALSETGRLRGVASRRPDKAFTFIESLKNPDGGSITAYGSYRSILEDPAIDAIYIALPNTLHFEWTAAALRSGKQVLCEKPLALNRREAEELFDIADKNGALLMEGFMYRAHPRTHLLLDTVSNGEIGTLQLIQINFCFNRPAAKEDARFHPNEGGGSLMDVGCYCIDLARSLTGQEPVRANGIAHLHEWGVDDYFAGSLAFPNGVLASFVCGMTLTTDQTTRLYGTEGWIEIPRFWKAAEGFTIHRPEREPENIQLLPTSPLPPLYAIEADAFAGVLRGAPNWNPRENTVGNLKVLEMLRNQIQADPLTR